jgi:PAS domain-containing protein
MRTCQRLLFSSLFITIGKRRNMKRFAIVFLSATLLLTACAGAQVRSAFNKTLERYNDLVRWNDMDRAILFASPSISAEFGKRAEEARKAKIFDYQVIDVKYDEKTRRASAVVVYSYYMYTTGEVKKVTDNQKWTYASGNGIESWQLQSLLPEFQ